MTRYLALDYGAKRIGVAMSDPTRTLATPLPFLNATPFNKLVGELRSLIKEKEVGLIIIGIPRNMDGTYGPSAEKAKEFAARLKDLILVPIETVDERLSTVQASRLLHEAGRDSRKQKGLIDSASAQILLQSYIDSPKTSF